MHQHAVLTFGPFELDSGSRECRREGERICLQKKPLDVLIYLISHRDRVVGKKELIEAVWCNLSVSEHALTSALRDLRRALVDAESGMGPVVTTVRGSGYRFTPEVKVLEPFPRMASRSGEIGAGATSRSGAVRQLRAQLDAFLEDLQHRDEMTFHVVQFLLKTLIATPVPIPERSLVDP
jgi:DNA-binding winged helix-turn-helix (wHTH) protein